MLQRDWYAPIVADAEAGFGGPLNVFELMKSMIRAGAGGVHLEDQLSSEKKCGHLGGKVRAIITQALQTYSQCEQLVVAGILLHSGAGSKSKRRWLALTSQGVAVAPGGGTCRMILGHLAGSSYRCTCRPRGVGASGHLFCSDTLPSSLNSGSFLSAHAWVSVPLLNPLSW